MANEDRVLGVEIVSAMTATQLVEMGKAAQNQAMRLAIKAARAEWVRLAQTTLRSTMQTYINGIQQPEVEPGRASVALVGVLPNALEHGQKSYDMHATLLGPGVPVVPRGSGLPGKYARKNGKGYYRFIPFRHGGPTSVGQAGAAMGAAYGGHAAVADAMALGRAIQKEAKRLKPSVMDPLRPGKTMWGGSLPAGMAPKLREHHATDIYAGMVKVQKTYKKAAQNQYMTFRTISTGSKGWVRKATVGLNLNAKVRTFVEGILPSIIGAIMGKQTQP